MIRELIQKAYETSEVERSFLLPFEESYQGNSLGKDELYFEIILGDAEKIVVEEEHRDDAYNSEWRRGYFIPRKVGTIIKETYIRTFDGYKEIVTYHIFTKKGWVEVEV